MTEKEFILKYGDEQQKVTRNFSSKSLGTNYDVKDAFIEFVDNAYDARINGQHLNVDIIADNDAKTLTICDNGTGISDPENLFKLGGTDKELSSDKIGKYGMGVPGATSAIARRCVFNHDEVVEIVYESTCNGRGFTKHIGIFKNQNGDTIYGNTNEFYCDEKLHYTKVTFSNVSVMNLISDVIDALEETFEIPLGKDLNIHFNGRDLGKTIQPTFVGDEPVRTVKVGNFDVDLKYRIIGGDVSNARESRTFEEAGLRIYDKKSGRLLAKSNDLWNWFANRQAQPTICGLRCGMFIDSSIECYNDFGIKPAKNGVTYRKYHKNPKFSELSSLLAAIYSQASAKQVHDKGTDVIKLDGRSFQPTPLKMDAAFKEVSPGEYFIKNKLNTLEIATLVNRVITLEKKLSNKSRKAK